MVLMEEFAQEARTSNDVSAFNVQAIFIFLYIIVFIIVLYYRSILKNKQLLSPSLLLPS